MPRQLALAFSKRFTPSMPAVEEGAGLGEAFALVVEEDEAGRAVDADQDGALGIMVEVGGGVAGEAPDPVGAAPGEPRRRRARSAAWREWRGRGAAPRAAAPAPRAGTGSASRIRSRTFISAIRSGGKAASIALSSASNQASIMSTAPLEGEPRAVGRHADFARRPWRSPARSSRRTRHGRRGAAPARRAIRRGSCRPARSWPDQ